MTMTFRESWIYEAIHSVLDEITLTVNDPKEFDRCWAICGKDRDLDCLIKEKAISVFHPNIKNDLISKRGLEVEKIADLVQKELDEMQEIPYFDLKETGHPYCVNYKRMIKEELLEFDFKIKKYNGWYANNNFIERLVS